MEKKLTLKQILIIFFCVTALISTTLPFFYVSTFYVDSEITVDTNFCPAIDLHPLGLVLPLLISPVLLPCVACLPCFARHRKLWSCATAVLNIIIFLCCYFFLDGYLQHRSPPYYSSFIYQFGDISGIGAFLMLLCYCCCLLITLLPEYFPWERPAPKQIFLKDRDVESIICETCGEKLWQDGRCPACYERMVLLKKIQEMTNSSP